MKALMALGALVGFLIGSSFALAGQSPWPTALWRACAAALIAAVLTRWWARVWMQGLREALEERRHARPAPTVGSKPNGKI
jgi:hypothetical protein